MVLRPAGVLATANAADLRDAVCKAAVEQPRAVIVDLSELSVPQHGALHVFGAAWSRIQTWPGRPLIVVPGSERMRRDLRTVGLSRSIPAYGSLAEALANIAEPPLRLRAYATLPGELGAARSARRFVTRTCREWPVELTEQAAYGATIVATELVENTARHTSVPDLQVRVEWRPGTLTVACRDADPRPAVLGDPATDERKGLLLVAQLSRTCGCLAHPAGGKVVWAALDAEVSPHEDLELHL